MKAGWWRASESLDAAEPAGLTFSSRTPSPTRNAGVCRAAAVAVAVSTSQWWWTGVALFLATAGACAEPLTVARSEDAAGASDRTAALPVDEAMSTPLSARSSADDRAATVSREIEITRDLSPNRELLAALRGEALAPPHAPSVDTVAHRWWMGAGRTRVGMGFGMATLWDVPPGHGDHLSRSAATVIAFQPIVSLGLRYRLTPDTRVFADATRLRASPRSGEDDDDAVAGGVGVEWKAARRAPLGFDRGSLRFQLRSGSLMSLKVRKGSIGVQLRTDF
jgi:hypothetical protein